MLIKNKNLYLILVAIALNGLASLIVTLKHQPISVDGILYLKSAQHFLDSGITAATKVYPWPFYSILLGLFSKASSLSLMNSAICLNTFFSTLIVVYFLLLIKALNGHRAEQCWGLAVILLCPFLNHERINILRDMGYYAFFLMSLYYFIRFIQLLSNRQAIGWQISILAATLFRIEGLFLYFFAPLFARKKIFTLYSIGIVLLIFAVLLSKNIFHFGRIPEMLGYFNFPSFINEYQLKILQQKQILGVVGQDSVFSYLLGGLCGIFLSTFIQCLGIFSIIILIYNLYHYQKFKFNSHAIYVICVYAFIVFAILVTFLMKQFFITERYLFPLVLLLMVFMPFGLALLWRENKIIYKIFIVIFLITSTISSFGQFGTSKSYIINAGTWISTHTPPNASLYTNDPLIAFYSQRNGIEYSRNYKADNLQNIFHSENIVKYDYVALLIKHSNTYIPMQQSSLNLINTFSNNKNDIILIFSVNKPPKLDLK
jgi:hypothetical protein